MTAVLMRVTRENLKHYFLLLVLTLILSSGFRENSRFLLNILWIMEGYGFIIITKSSVVYTGYFLTFWYCFYLKCLKSKPCCDLYNCNIRSLGITCPFLDLRFASSNPAEIEVFFQDLKILNTNPLWGFFKLLVHSLRFIILSTV